MRGLDVVCADRDETRLRTLMELAPAYMNTPGEVSRLHPVRTELSASHWPFSQHCFSAIVCVHFLDVRLLPLFFTSLVIGGYLYLETIGGQGQNYLDLPKEGLLRALLSREFQLLFYRERRIGPANFGAVSVKLFAHKSAI
jgi:hypothetical protein